MTESDLCIIVGNLLENAVEACERMGSGRRFIRLGSSGNALHSAIMHLNFFP